MRNISLSALVLICLSATSAFAQKTVVRDEFFWLGQMNKATTLINSEEGLLDKAMLPKIAAGLVKVLEDGAQPNAIDNAAKDLDRDVAQLIKVP
ncbi:MAG: hypothetical protein EBQ58_12975 [Betaproteobacteria bacterium]|nr:hypothetical protein [Betaproteobacteria bacterium]